MNHQVQDLSLFLSSFFSLKGLNFDHSSCSLDVIWKVEPWKTYSLDLFREKGEWWELIDGEDES
jgi:hypothetical protein